MIDKNVAILSDEFKQKPSHIANVVSLIDEGNTIPFIARYRKEMTGSMDDQLLREVFDRLTYLRNLDKRKEEVLGSIETQGKLTEELTAAVHAASTMTEVEDLYRPFKQKRKTRASVARAKGLEPLALYIFEQREDGISLEKKAAEFIDEQNGVADAKEALDGANDIIAEDISDDADIRKLLRQLITTKGKIKSVAASEEDSVYATYYDFTEDIKKLPAYKVLALNRGEKEGFLKVDIIADEQAALSLIYDKTVKGNSELSAFVKAAAQDSYERLIFPSVEREIRSLLTQTADEQAINTFCLNLKPMLMQAPVKNKITLGFDPAFRTGCKLAVVDITGKVLDTAVIYPTAPHNKTEEAAKKLRELITKYAIDVISIGNGTASRESEMFVAETIKGTNVKYTIVNEAGASVYSASKLEAAEFPDYDVSLRSAVSIARRLQDPLAELVKIDPKSIGVGQYQHDMPPAQLNDALEGVVEDCVNSVGADVNTASASLLSHISGINAAIAKNIVAYREENGVFTSRSQLKKVPKLGEKSFVQCAGFLRVPESKNVLDHTGVHPESYKATEKMLSLCGYTMQDVKEGNILKLASKIAQIGNEKIAEECGAGMPTLKDIIRELLKPGRDPRDELEAPMLRSDVMSMEDLTEGMCLTGTVRNVVDFGAFVDIGVHQDGLVHISQMSDKFIKHPSEVVTAGDIVSVYVTGVDLNKNRISLSMKQQGQ